MHKVTQIGLVLIGLVVLIIVIINSSEPNTPTEQNNSNDLKIDKYSVQAVFRNEQLDANHKPFYVSINYDLLDENPWDHKALIKKFIYEFPISSIARIVLDPENKKLKTIIFTIKTPVTDKYKNSSIDEVYRFAFDASELRKLHFEEVEYFWDLVPFLISDSGGIGHVGAMATEEFCSDSNPLYTDFCQKVS